MNTREDTTEIRTTMYDIKRESPFSVTGDVNFSSVKMTVTKNPNALSMYLEAVMNNQCPPVKSEDESYEIIKKAIADAVRSPDGKCSVTMDWGHILTVNVPPELRHPTRKVNVRMKF